MRLRVLLRYAGLRQLSAMNFDGKVPLNSIKKTVTFREDQQAPQVEIRVPLIGSEWINPEIADRLRKSCPHRIDRLVLFSFDSFQELTNSHKISKN